MHKFLRHLLPRRPVEVVSAWHSLEVVKIKAMISSTKRLPQLEAVERPISL